MSSVAGSTQTGVWKGATAEQRRAERLERLLDAGLDVLGTAGWAETSVRAVCRQAGLSSRYFYESFTDLDELLVAVFDRIMATATEKILTAIAAAPHVAQARARAAVETGVACFTDDPRHARVIFIEAVGNERLMRRRLDIMRSYAQITGAQARDLLNLPPGSDALADATATMLMGGFVELLIRWLDAGLPHTREQLITDMSDLLIVTGDAVAALAQRRAENSTYS